MPGVRVLPPNEGPITHEEVESEQIVIDYSEELPTLYRFDDLDKPIPFKVEGGSGKGTRRKHAVPFSEIEQTRVEWYWRGRIPKGAVTLLDGDPEMGKSTTTFDILARFTAGKALPDGESTPPRKCLILTGEEQLGHVKAKLSAAGFDETRCFALPLVRKTRDGEAVPFTVPDDLPTLKGALRESKAQLVLIDPIYGFLSEHINSHNDASLRKALQPLGEIAEERGCAIIGIRHLKKDQRETNPLYRGGGSIAGTGVARSLILVGKSPLENDPSYMNVYAMAKTSMIRKLSVPSLKYEITEWDQDPDVPVVKWHGTCSVTARDILSTTDARTQTPAQDEAEEVLDQIFDGDGWFDVNEVYESGKAAGVSLKTLKNAINRRGYHKTRKYRPGGGVDKWLIHRHDGPCPEDCPDKGTIPYDVRGA